MGRGTRYRHVEDIIRCHVDNEDFVLEIGCGGAVYKDLFGKYIGSDLPGNPYEEPGNIDVYCDAQVLPFKNDTFDFVFLVACLYQIPNTHAVLSESKRVLKEDGKILIFDYNLKTTQRLRRLENNGNNQNHVWSPFKLASIVKKAGFETSISCDYAISKPHARWKRNLLKTRAGRYIAFISMQILKIEGWNIVIGRKY
jgi:SAM-dependent methyltransferase